MKRLTILLLAVVMIMTATQSVSVAYAEVDESLLLPYSGDPIEITMMGWQSYSHYNWENMFGQWLSERLGNVTIVSEIPADDAQTKLDLYLSSGNMPDIIMYRNPDTFMLNYGDGSRTLNLLDYADYMPEYVQRREQFSHLSRYDTDDGATYMFFPCWYNSISEVWFANMDLLEKYDLDVPTNYEEMKNCMEVVCEAEPNVDGMMYLPWGFNYAYTQFSTLFGNNRLDPTSIAYDYDQGKWVFALSEYEEIYKTTTAELAEAYAKGWINADFSTWDGASFDVKRKNGEWLFSNSYYNEGTDHEKDGINVSYITTPAVKGVTPFVCTDYQSDVTGWIYMVSSNTQHPEICCQILELLGSEEYAIHYYWGNEGETYTVDADGKRAYTDAYLSVDDETKKAVYGIARTIPYFTDAFTSNYYIGDAICANYGEASLTALTDCAEKLTSGEYATYYSALLPAFDEYVQEDIAVITTAYSTYINENIIKFVLGTKDMSEWDAFIAGLSAYGDMDWALNEYNTAEQAPYRDLQADRTWLTP